MYDVNYYNHNARIVNDMNKEGITIGNTAHVHIGFLLNQQRGKHIDVFKASRTSIKRDVETGEYIHYENKQSMCLFNVIYRCIRNCIAGSTMKEMKFRHCEMAFDLNMFHPSQLSPVNGFNYTNECYAAYGTNLNEKVVTRKPRTFVHKNDAFSRDAGIINGYEAYKWIHLRIPRSSVISLISFCEAEVGKEYDIRALERMMFLPSRLSSTKDWDVKQKWHCTNFTACMLQQCGFLKGLNPNALSADSVYFFLKDNIHEVKTVATPAFVQQEIRNGML